MGQMYPNRVPPPATPNRPDPAWKHTWKRGRDGDGDLADAILRKVARKPAACVLVERFNESGFGGLIDSSWISLTGEEADYLDRIRREEDS